MVGAQTLQALYEYLPLRLRTIAVSVAGWWARRGRLGGVFATTRENLERSQWLSTEALVEGARIRATELVRDFFADVHGRCIESIAEVPITQKDDVRANPEAYRNPSIRDVVIWKTGGTTGVPLAVPLEKAAIQREYAFIWQHREWLGCKIGDRIATFAGRPVVPVSQVRPPYWVFNKPNNQMFFSVYHIAPHTLKLYVDALAAFSPVLIHGYPSAIALIAQGILESGTRVQPRAIVTASETLEPHQRHVIREAFGVEPRIWYGNTEMAGNLVECPHGRIHVREEHSYTEFLAPADTVPAGYRRLVATPLLNRAFVLPRYDTGDLVILAEEKRCPCGRGGRLVKAIVGRQDDYIIDGEGRWIARLGHLFKDVQGVMGGQVYQEEAGVIEIRVVLTPRASEEDVARRLREAARKRVAPSTQVVIRFVDSLIRTKSGKQPLVVSKLGSSRG